MAPAKADQSPATLTLSDSVSSPQDVAALLDEVRSYARWASHSLIKQRVVSRPATVQANATDETAPVLTPGAKILLAAWAAQTADDGSGSRALTPASLDALVEELQAIIETAPTLSITLAAPPSASIKKSLVAWCRTNIAADALISFSFNATLLGGMVVRFGSHVYDWSFRRQILENRNKIPEVLRRV
jgi:hypothetical protein